MAELTLGSVQLQMALPLAGTAVREALASQGFGVLSEIDVAATLKAKLGVERSPLVVLGACNPSIADRALQLDAGAALVLPCNVVLSSETPEHTTVTIADPRTVLVSGALAEVAGEAASRLLAVLEKLSPERA